MNVCLETFLFIIFFICQEYFGERSFDGKRHGVGKTILPNRDQYEGDYREGLRDGHGIYHFKNGARYDGEWKKGLKHGRGKFTYPDGSSYCGDWKHNMKHGFGRYLYENGDIYEGTWKNDVKHGVGTYKYKETDITTKATWIDGTLKGPIEILYANFRYHGYWNKDHPVGEGAFSFGMKHMLPGHVDFYPNPDFVQKKDSETSNEIPKSFDENAVNSVPKCIPQFIAHNIETFDYSKLPQHPMQLPTADSASTICTQSSKSEVHIYQVQSPILIAADPVEFEELQEEEKETRENEEKEKEESYSNEI